MTYSPKVGDLFVWHNGEEALVRLVVAHDSSFITCEDEDGEQECLLADEFNGMREFWSLVARGAVPLENRPPVPERDERSEVERLRTIVANTETVARLCSEECAPGDWDLFDDVLRALRGEKTER